MGTPFADKQKTAWLRRVGGAVCVSLVPVGCGGKSGKGRGGTCRRNPPNNESRKRYPQLPDENSWRLNAGRKMPDTNSSSEILNQRTLTQTTWVQKNVVFTRQAKSCSLGAWNALKPRFSARQWQRPGALGGQCAFNCRNFSNRPESLSEHLQTPNRV